MPTTNPVPSTDPSDLLFNAGRLDEVVNGAANSFTDRLGVSRRTLAGIDAAADNVLNSIGYAVPVTYASGISLTLTNQTVEFGGVVYAPKSSALPFTTSSWGADSEKFRVIQVTDAAYLSYSPGGAGAVATTAAQELDKIVYVTRFGASPTASASYNAAAIQLAADYANSIGAKLVGVPGTFIVGATINLNCNADLGMMTITADANVVSPIVRFGTTSGSATSYKIITLPQVKNNNRTAGTWGAGIGIELANCNTNTITIPSATECEVGVTCGGYNSGFAYNNVTLMFLYSNKVNLRLMPAASGGWCNQNVFIGGRLGNNSTDFTVSGYTGTRDIVLDQGTATNGGPNNNTFINTSVETDALEYMIAFEKNTAYNQFIGLRYEGSNKNVLFNTDLAAGHNTNLFIGGFQAESIAFTYSGTGTSIYNCRISPRRSDFEGTSSTINIGNRGSAGVDAPHIQGFTSGTTPLGKTAGNTDWVYRTYANGLSGKRATDDHPRLTLDYQNGRFYAGSGTAAPTRYMGAFGSLLGSASDWVPHGDNLYAMGSAAYRWSVVYSATGAINTSDEREKQDIAAINDAEKRVAVSLKGLVKKFRFKDAVSKKGDYARIHVGVIAQEVMAVFQAEGLDPMRYSIVCYDEWGAEDEEQDADGNVTKPARDAGGRYGIRYDELLAFIIAAL